MLAAARDAKGSFISLAAWRLFYWLLALPPLALLAWHTANHTWGSDFWGHVAVVRELSTNPLRPQHPILLADAPHAFFSPYAVCLGLISRATGLDPVSILPLAGLVNLVLLMGALRLFVGSVSSARAAPFLALLFTLFLWGSSPWDWAGFFHLRSLGGVLPYHSTFAVSAALLGLVAYSRYLAQPRLICLAALALLLWLVLLTHPLTAIFLFIGLAALTLHDFRWAHIRRYAALAGASAVAVVGAVAWPYYPFLELLTSPSVHYDLDQREMYQNVLVQIYPALLGLPFLFLRLRANWRDPLGAIFLAVGALYLYGFLSGQWRYGRMMPFVVLCLHLALAVGLAAARPAQSMARPRSLSLSVARGAVAIGLALSASDLAGYVRQVRSEQQWYEGYLFLGQHTQQHEVVLADLNTSNVVPAFGGKVVAASRFLAFVPDHEQRERDVEEFFAGETPQQRREEILRQYRVDWLLVDREVLLGSQTNLSELRRFGQVAYEDRQRGLILVRVDLTQSSRARQAGARFTPSGFQAGFSQPQPRQASQTSQ